MQIRVLEYWIHHCVIIIILKIRMKSLVEILWLARVKLHMRESFCSDSPAAPLLLLKFALVSTVHCCQLQSTTESSDPPSPPFYNAFHFITLTSHFIAMKTSHSSSCVTLKCFLVRISGYTKIPSAISEYFFTAMQLFC